jgi:hypothetical protein
MPPIFNNTQSFSALSGASNTEKSTPSMENSLRRQSTFGDGPGRRFSVTADSISDLPQPHYDNFHTCSICEELRMHADEPAKAKEVYNNPMERYRTSKLLDAARNGCCFSSICIQAAAGFVKNPVANALSMVKTDPDE